MASRLEELNKLYFGESGKEANWQSIKAIAEPLGINKPDGGWDEAIPLIVKAEQAKATTAVNKPPATRVVSRQPIVDTPWRKVRTDLRGRIIPDPFKGES